MKFIIYIICYILIYNSLVLIGSVMCDNSTVSLEEAILRQEEIDDVESNRNVIVRRRRYLTFPEGCSFQLVHCLTYGMYLGISDIFYMGITISMAWQLPTEPYRPLKHIAAILKSKSDDTRIIDEPGDTYNKDPPVFKKNYLVNKYTGEAIQPYVKQYFNKKYGMNLKKGQKIHHSKKKVFFNPVFAKRSVSDVKKNHKERRASVMKIHRDGIYTSKAERVYLKTEHMNWKNIEFHRTSRSSLYEKLEKFIGSYAEEDGKHCVLKTLCETGQDKGLKKGSFRDEILRAVFTLHSGNEFKTKHQQAYDIAYSTKKNCSETYYQCTKSIKTGFK